MNTCRNYRFLWNCLQTYPTHKNHDTIIIHWKLFTKKVYNKKKTNSVVSHIQEIPEPKTQMKKK